MSNRSDGGREDDLRCARVVAAVLGPLLAEGIGELAESHGDDLGDEVVLGELADLLGAALVSPSGEQLVEACCEALEALCGDPACDPESSVYLQVLATLSPASRDRVRSYLGPLSEELLDRFEPPE